MQSQYGEVFNHDPWAAIYDANVAGEPNPVGTGYAAVPAWTVEQAQIKPSEWVVDLGAGTGNTALHIGAAGRVGGGRLSARRVDGADTFEKQQKR